MYDELTGNRASCSKSSSFIFCFFLFGVLSATGHTPPVVAFCFKVIENYLTFLPISFAVGSKPLRFLLHHTLRHAHAHVTIVPTEGLPLSLQSVSPILAGCLPWWKELRKHTGDRSISTRGVECWLSPEAVFPYNAKCARILKDEYEVDRCNHRFHMGLDLGDKSPGSATLPLFFIRSFRNLKC